MNDDMAFLNPLQFELAASVPGKATPEKPAEVPMWSSPDFLLALRSQETGLDSTDEYRINAVGDKGRAVGPYQIWPVYVEQANKLLGKDAKQFTLEDRKDFKRSEEMIGTVLPWLSGQFEKQYKRKPTMTELAKLHNAGAMGSFNTPKNMNYGFEFSQKQRELDKRKKEKEKPKK